MRAVGYIRVSTEEQVKEGISLGNQASKIEAFCVAKGWTLKEIIRDEGKSAKDLKRDGIQRLIAGIKQHEFDVVVIYKLDRLTRSVRDLGYLVQDVFEKNGVAFSSINDSFDTSTASGKLVLNILGALSQCERETIAERTRDGLNYKKSKHQIYGAIPYGFDGMNYTLVPNETEMAIVRRIFKLRQELKYSYRKIAERLNAEGITTRTGKEWFASSIRVIANNDIYDYALGA